MNFKRTAAAILAALCLGTAAASPASAAGGWIFGGSVIVPEPARNESNSIITPKETKKETAAPKVTVTPDKSWDDGSYPYPALLDFTDLESSFDKLAAPKIRDPYCGYVLTALKYHIASSADNYRAGKTLSASEGGNLLFFFEGCSPNLDGATVTAGGFLIKKVRYNTSAVCILVQKNKNGRAEITFVSCEASTMPDNVRDTSFNGAFPVPTVRDGIYKLTAVNNNGEYAAVHLVDPAVIRCSETGSTVNNTRLNPVCDEINLHIRSIGGISAKTAQSVGCLAMENTYSSNYFDFMRTVLGTKLPSSLKISAAQEGKSAGLIIIDRSLYKTELAKIFGDDSAPGGLTGKQIAAKLTEDSEAWNTAVSARAPVYVRPKSAEKNKSGKSAQAPQESAPKSSGTTKSAGGWIIVVP